MLATLLSFWNFYSLKICVFGLGIHNLWAYILKNVFMWAVGNFININNVKITSRVAKRSLF